MEYDGDRARDQERAKSGLEALIEIVERLKRGELYLADYYVNESGSDPYRKNVQFKVTRGEQADQYEQPVRFAEPPTPRAALEAEARRLEQKIAEMRRAEYQKKKRGALFDGYGGVGDPPRTAPTGTRVLGSDGYMYDEYGVKYWPEESAKNRRAPPLPPVKPKPPAKPKPPKPIIDRSKGARELDLD